MNDSSVAGLNRRIADLEKSRDEMAKQIEELLLSIDFIVAASKAPAKQKEPAETPDFGSEVPAELYGEHQFAENPKNVSKEARRAWERANEMSTPPGTVLVGLCDEKYCISPSHRTPLERSAARTFNADRINRILADQDREELRRQLDEAIVVMPDGHWAMKSGGGTLALPGDRQVGAGKVALWLGGEPLPFVVRNRCGRSGCVNPEHLKADRA